jgi:hypothetical protein
MLIHRFALDLMLRPCQSLIASVDLAARAGFSAGNDKSRRAVLSDIATLAPIAVRTGPANRASAQWIAADLAFWSVAESAVALRSGVAPAMSVAWVVWEGPTEHVYFKHEQHDDGREDRPRK